MRHTAKRNGILLLITSLAISFSSGGSNRVYGQCGVVVRQRVIREEVVVVKKNVIEVVPTIIPYFQPILIPAYGAGYNPLYAPPVVQGGQLQQGQGQPPIEAQSRSANSRDDAILKELQRLNQRLDALEKRGNITPMNRPPNDPSNDQESINPIGNGGLATNATIVLPILQSKCAACHTQDKADKQGGGFAFMLGNGPRKMSDIELRKVTKKVKSGAMPPADNKVGIVALTQDEGNAILNWLEDQ